MTARERFLAACRCQPVDRPPVWIMRQAGRALPEYRALKEKYSFVELVRTPDLAAEVTLQPIRRFDFDAAIVFSDILVIPEALGQPYEFIEGQGIKMTALRSEADIARLDPSAVQERLAYVSAALRLVRRDLGERTALIGFAGSPWTLANFMLEGGGADDYTKARRLFYSDRPLFDRLLRTLTDAIIGYLRCQIEAGADALQIFDSLGGQLMPPDFQAASGRWMADIIAGLGARVPVIVFSRGTHGNWDELSRLGAQIIGLDWTVDLARVRASFPAELGVQGNLDPLVLTTTPEIVRSRTQRFLQEARGMRGHIVNLGHGLPPTAALENIQAMVDTVRQSV